MKYRMLSLLLTLPVLSLGGCDGDGYWDHMDEWRHGPMHTWFGGIFMWIIWVIILGLIIYFIFAATQSRAGKGPPEPKETPLDVLKMRYAKGEITKEQFEEMKRGLEK